MPTTLYSRIVMLGPAPETRAAATAVVDACRAAGLFARWPVEYVAAAADGSIIDKTKVFGIAVRNFASLLAQHGRVVVHAHVSAGAAFWRDAVLMSAALAARCPLVMQLHGTGFGPETRFFLQRAACVIVPCEASRIWARSVCRSANVLVVPPPVALEVAPAASKQNLVLFLGRLDAAKGIYDLLDAVARLRAAVPDVRLVCAGDGDRVGVAHYAERLGMADAVSFTGWVGPSGKRALLENAAVYALPSYDEALPASLLEAMSAGVPPVVTPVGGVAEAVQDGVTGLIVAPGDKAALERSLRKILLDKALAERIGEAARESARRRFAPERVLPRLEDLYAALGVSAQGTQPRRDEPELKKAA